MQPRCNQDATQQVLGLGTKSAKQVLGTKSVPISWKADVQHNLAQICSDLSSLEDRS